MVRRTRRTRARAHATPQPRVQRHRLHRSGRSVVTTSAFPHTAASLQARPDDQVFEIAYELVAYATPLALMAVLAMFFQVYLISTFTRCSCASGRKLLRVLDIRRDPARVFGTPGEAVLAAPSTAGGCSLTLILAIALVKITLDINAGASVDACTETRVAAEAAIGAQFATLQEVPRAIQDNLNRAYINYRWEFDAKTVGMTFLNPDDVVDLALGENCDYFRSSRSPIISHLPPALVEYFILHAQCLYVAPDVDAQLGEALAISFTPPVPVGMTLFLNKDNAIPQYALTNDCMDLALLRQQVPSFRAFSGCATETVIVGVAGAENASSNIIQRFLERSVRRFTQSEVKSRVAAMTREARTYVGRRVPVCNRIVVSGYDGMPVPPLRRAGRAPVAPGMFSPVWLDAFEVGRLPVSVVTTIGCQGSLTLPVPELYVPSRLISMRRALSEVLPEQSNQTWWQDPNATVWPACRYATGNALDTSLSTVDRVSPYTPPNKTRYSLIDMAGTAEGVHRFYFGFPTNDGVLPTATYYNYVSCPGLSGVFITALSSIGGLLVFHPFLRAALLKLRRRAAFPATARRIHKTQKAEERTVDGAAHGVVAATAAGSMAATRAARTMLSGARAKLKERRTPACVTKLRNGSMRLHHTVRSLLAMTVVLIALLFGSLVTMDRAASALETAPLATGSLALAFSLVFACGSCAMCCWIADAAVAMRMVCFPICRYVFRARNVPLVAKATIAGFAFLSVLASVMAVVYLNENGGSRELTSDGYWWWNAWSLFFLAVMTAVVASLLCLPCPRVRRLFAITDSDRKKSKQAARRRRSKDGLSDDEDTSSSSSSDDSTAHGDGDPADEKGADEQSRPLRSAVAAADALRQRGGAASGGGGTGVAGGSRASRTQGRELPRQSVHVRPPAPAQAPSARSTGCCSVEECCRRTRVVLCRGAPLQTCWRGVGYDETPLSLYNPAAGAKPAGDGVEMLPPPMRSTTEP